MANGSIITDDGARILLNRGYKSSPDNSVPSQIKVGINNSTPQVGDTALDTPIPIANGTTNDDGSNQMTGSNGGDNTTNNTTTFKIGAGNSDDTAQNLIANDTNATKTWTISDLSSNGSNIDGSQSFALWLYIDTQTVLDKLKSSGTALEIKLGSDSSNYYSLTQTASNLSTGWNWVTSGTDAVNELTETGSVSGNIDTFIIEITTNNATDTFSAGDVVYDLLRQWSDSDLTDAFVSGYPTFDYDNRIVTIRGYLDSTEANGFDINGLGVFNTDSTPLMHGEDTFTAESKSDTDEFALIPRDRIIR